MISEVIFAFKGKQTKLALLLRLPYWRKNIINEAKLGRRRDAGGIFPETAQRLTLIHALNDDFFRGFNYAFK